MCVLKRLFAENSRQSFAPRSVDVKPQIVFIVQDASDSTPKPEYMKL